MCVYVREYVCVYERETVRESKRRNKLCSCCTRASERDRNANTERQRQRDRRREREREERRRDNYRFIDRPIDQSLTLQLTINQGRQSVAHIDALLQNEHRLVLGILRIAARGQETVAGYRFADLHRERERGKE